MDRRGRPKLDRWQPLLSLKAAPRQARAEGTDGLIGDVGRIVNRLTLHGQAIGGMVQGLGGAFLEHLVYDANGQLLAGNLADYLIPTARLSKDPGDCAREPPVTE